MESFYIDLNQLSSKKSKLFRVWAVGAVVFTVFGLLLTLIFKKHVGRAELPIVAIAVYFLLYIYFAWVTYKSKLYIQADEYSVEYKFGMLKGSSEKVIWETVVKIKIGPTYIAFFKRSGKRKVIRLGWLPYSKVIEIKNRVCSVCEFKGIRCEKSEFLHFTFKK